MNHEKTVYAGIDWYTGTKSYKSLEVNAPHNDREAEVVARKIFQENDYWRGRSLQFDARKEAFYDWTFTDGDYLRLSLSSRQSQGVKVVLSGHDWAVGERHSLEQWHSLLRQDWHHTRIDIAFDFLNFGYNVKDIFEKNLKEQAYNGKRKTSLITSPQGSTIALGSRTSEKYARLYEKGMEQRTYDDWFRVEIELKGRTARSYADHYEAILRKGAKAILTMTARLPEEMNDFLVEFTHGVNLPEVGRKQTRGNREKWLLTQIVPLLKEERAKDSPAWRAFLEAMSKP